MNNEVQSGDTARDLLESIVLWVESTALEHRMPATVKHARRFLDRTEPEQPVEAAGQLAATTFICHLIDNHEGEKVTEESLQSWFAEALAHPRPVVDLRPYDGMRNWEVIADAATARAELTDPKAARKLRCAMRSIITVGLAAGGYLPPAAPDVDQAGEVVELKWPGPWNSHHFPVDTIAKVFGKAAFEAATMLRLGPPNHSDIGIVLLQQLGAAGFGICRDQPRPVGVPDGVLSEVHAERERQDAKWGPQNHPDFSEQAEANPPEARSVCLGMVREHEAKFTCQDHFARGVGSWSDIMIEEVVEAFCAPSEAALRKELVQVAAVATAWAECIDRRAGRAAAPAPAKAGGT